MKIPAALAALGLVTTAAAADTDQPLAVDVLDEITVTEDHPMDDYDRELFAPTGWTDANGSGCTTREDILARDLDDETLVVDGCTVEYGETIGAYSAEQIEHVQGSSEVDIEHVVAIGQSWRNGAHDWDEETRHEFYQDPENLIAVSASENQAKGSRDVTEYMPPNQGAYCEFAAAKVYVKDKYDLTMNPEEHTFTTDVLNDPECEGTPAAPAQAIYTSDWDTTPTSASGNNSENPLTGLLDDTHPLLLAGLALAGLLALAVLIFSPGARRTLTRHAKRSARRTVRRSIRAGARG